MKKNTGLKKNSGMKVIAGRYRRYARGKPLNNISKSHGLIGTLLGLIGIRQSDNIFIAKNTKKSRYSFHDNQGGEYISKSISVNQPWG
jgi:hypothetical protein